MAKWQSTKFPGVRFRSHPSRKNGVQPDKYFSIYYRVGGRRREEGVGWSLEGWNAQKAAHVLAGLKEAQTTGEGAVTLEEKRQNKEIERQKEETQRQRKDAANITFGQYWERHYLPEARASKKASSWKKEQQHVRDWLGPVLAAKPLQSITSDDLRDVRNKLQSNERSLRTVQHVFSTFRLIWNSAKSRGIVTSVCPTKVIKLGKIQNERTRFLSSAEIQTLLEHLEEAPLTHALTLTAICTGARAGEIFSLTWGDVDFDTEEIRFRHTKTGEPRTIPMLPDLKEVLQRQQSGGRGELVFVDRKGQRLKSAPSTFYRVVKKLFNQGIDDPREIVCFHSLRHTAASHMLRARVDVRTIQMLFGWSTLQMLSRYTHVVDEAKREAVKGLGRALKSKDGTVLPFVKTATLE